MRRAQSRRSMATGCAAVRAFRAFATSDRAAFTLCILFYMDDVERTPLRERALHEISGIIADGGYASLLAIPVAIGVAAYTFVYLSFLRHRLHRRAERSAKDRVRATLDARDQ
jgi:hypothetical protein